MHYSHRLSEARIHQIVGWFVIVPIVVLGVALFLIGKNENLFEEKYEITTVMKQGYGLEPGHPVVMRGIQIGRVSKVEFTEQDNARITLKLLKKYQEKIRSNSVAKIGKTGGFFGDPQIEITTGDKKLPIVAANATIAAEEPFDIGELLAGTKPLMETIQKTVGRVEQITQDVQATVKTGHDTLLNVQEASAKLPEVMGNIGRSTAAVSDAARAAASELPGIAASARQSVNRVGEIVEDVKTTSAKLPAVLDDVKAATNDLKGIIHEDVPGIVNSAQGTMEDVNEIVTGAKKTFPISLFASKGRTARVAEGSQAGPLKPPSLRQDDLTPK